MSWIFLFLAAAFEVAWAVGLKYTQGFTRPLPTVIVLVCIAMSMGLLGLAVRTLPMSTAYAVWTGIGALGTAAFGIIILGEPGGVMRLGCIGLIAAGVVGLRLLER